MNSKSGQEMVQGACPETPLGASEATLVSVVTPAYNEAKNLQVLYQRLVRVFKDLEVPWEWIVVDDHSADTTFDVIRALSLHDDRVRGFRLARNSGSHVALVCGLHQALGQCAVVLAADCQDPPELIPQLLDQWRHGAQVVWAVRNRREGETQGTLTFSRLYYFLMRRLFGLKELPATGADFFLADARVVEALRQFRERNVSLMALLTWMGFRQTQIFYDKQARLHGRSGWNFRKKLKLFVDSVTSFSYLPIRIMAVLGTCISFAGFLYACIVIFNALTGDPPQGWASLMVVVLVLGGVQMIMMSILGEYLWRALDEARRRPQFLVESSTERENHGLLIHEVCQHRGP